MRILVVDDNDLLAEALIIGLSGRGHEVARVRNGDDALRDALVSETQAVVIDWQMPGMRGDEVARRVRAMRPNVAIVLMSGDSSGTEIQEACRPGAAADSFIEKPFTPNQLLLVIRHAVDRKQAGMGN